MNGLFDKRLVLVTGKGGVGRTTLAGSIAVAGVKRGLRVLLTEIADPEAEYTPLARLFGTERFPDEPAVLEPGLWGVTTTAKRGHEAFFVRVIPVPALARAAMGSGALRRMLDAAPSLAEMGLFYHLLALLREEGEGGHRFDLVVFDMPASGHTLGLTGLPERVLELMPTGPIGNAMRDGRDQIYNPAHTAAWVVTLPEVLPVTEALELLEGLDGHGMPVGGVLVNKLVEDPFTADERAALTAPLAAVEVYGKARYVGADHAREALAALAERPGVAVKHVPEYPDQGRALLDHIAATLAAREAP